MASTRTRSRLIFWTGLAVVTVALTLTAGFVGWTLDPASLKPMLVRAAARATGRTLTVAGETRVRLGFFPTVTLDKVSLSNPPGFSRPEMVRVDRVELGLALLPLLRHRVVIDHVRLERPDIVLETTASGEPNWDFRRPPPVMVVSGPVSGPTSTAPPVAPTVAPSAPSLRPPRPRYTAVFKDAEVIDGRIGVIDGKTRHSYTAETPRLTLDAAVNGPVSLRGTILFDGRTIGLTAHAEPSELPGGEPGSGPWPVGVKLETGGATLTADGQVGDLAHLRDYTFAVDATVPDAGVLSAFFPRLPLSLVHDAVARVDIGDNGGRLPTISALHVVLGSVDLDRYLGGAQARDVTVTAKGDGKLRLAARVALAHDDAKLSGSIGDLAWLNRGATGPIAVDLAWHGGTAQGSVSGTIQAPSRLAGYALDVAAEVPDPSQVTNAAPPGLRSVVFRAHLSDAPAATPFQLTSNAGDLSGLVTVSRPPHGSPAWVSLHGNVWSRRIDLDTLRSPPPVEGPGTLPPGVGTPVTPSTAAGPSARPDTASGASPHETAEGPPGGQPPVTPPVKAAAVAPAANVGGPRPVIPDNVLPFGVLRRVDGQIGFIINQVVVNGAPVRKISGTVAVDNAKLRLDPFTIVATNQRLGGVLTVDDSVSPPAVHLAFDAPGLALGPVLEALGLPPLANGAVAVRADLSGQGDTLRALAASLNGTVGVATADGQLDARMVNSLLGQFKALHIGGADQTDLRCFAVRADAKDGVLALRPLAFDTPALIVEGNGDLDLRDETMALRLRPRTEIGKTGIALPVRLSGPWRSPSAKIDMSEKGPGGGLLAGLILGGKDVMGAAGGGDPCPAALAKARDVPTEVAAPPAAPGDPPPGVQK